MTPDERLTRLEDALAAFIWFQVSDPNQLTTTNWSRQGYGRVLRRFVEEIAAERRATS